MRANRYNTKNFTRIWLKFLGRITRQIENEKRLAEGAKGFRTKVRKRALWISGTAPKQS